MSMCRVFSCVVGRGCLLWPVHYLGKTLLVFALLHSTFQGQICLLLSRVQIFVTPWPVACQASLSMGFSQYRAHSNVLISAIIKCENIWFPKLIKLRFIHIVTNNKILCFLIAEKYVIVYTYFIFFIQSSVYRLIGCFSFLAIVSNTAMNMEYR